MNDKNYNSIKMTMASCSQLFKSTKKSITGRKAQVLTLAIVASFFVFQSTNEANAGLEICNTTGDVQEISIGYKGDGGWTSKGWWLIEPTKCATPIGDDLNQQTYYYRAEINGGPFEGASYYFCTDTAAYTIVGDTKCKDRGYDRESFQPFDVGSGTKDYTLTLTSANTTSVAKDEGLRICNETKNSQSVSIGYEGDEAWTSEGWWVMEPGKCSMVVRGELKDTYYYRAEVNGGDFDGEAYYFCTTPKAYTIYGDTDCKGRGYDRESFRLIDTSKADGVFTLTMQPYAPALPFADGAAAVNAPLAPADDQGAMTPGAAMPTPVVSPVAESTVTEYPISLEMMGLRFGMVPEEISEIAADELGNGLFVEISDVNFGGDDLFSRAQHIMTPTWPADGSNRLVATYDADLPEYGAIAIFRTIKLPKAVTEEVFQTAVLPDILKTYGIEAQVPGTLIWIGDPIQRAAATANPVALASCGDLALVPADLSLNGAESTWAGGFGPMLNTDTLASVTQACGDVISVNYSNNSINIGLWNSDFILERRTALDGRAGAVVPLIKF